MKMPFFLRMKKRIAGVLPGVGMTYIVYNYKGRQYYHKFRRPGRVTLKGNTIIASFPYALKYTKKKGFIN